MFDVSTSALPYFHWGWWLGEALNSPLLFMEISTVVPRYPWELPSKGPGLPETADSTKPYPYHAFPYTYIYSLKGSTLQLLSGIVNIIPLAF